MSYVIHKKAARAFTIRAIEKCLSFYNSHEIRFYFSHIELLLDFACFDLSRKEVKTWAKAAIRTCKKERDKAINWRCGYNHHVEDLIKSLFRTLENASLDRLLYFCRQSKGKHEPHQALDFLLQSRALADEVSDYEYGGIIFGSVMLW